jgi:hypothetical protein
VEKVRDVVATPTPGTEAWWNAVREAVYATPEGAGPVVGKAETVDWTGLLINSTYAPKSGARHCKEWRAFQPFLSLFFLRSAEEWRVDFTQFRMK